MFIKNRFSKFWAVSSIFDLLSSQISSLSLLRDENFFSLNRSNGASKNPSFHTDLKNVHMTVKSAHKKVLAKRLFYTNWKKLVFWAKLFLGALFTKIICTFFKSIWKDGFFDTPFDLIKEKKFSSHISVSVYFLWSKKSKMEATTQYFGKRFFINRS